MVVDEDDEILLINSEGTIIRIKSKRSIRSLAERHQGVKIMRTDDESNIISMAKVIREEEHERDMELALKKKAEQEK